MKLIYRFDAEQVCQTLAPFDPSRSHVFSHYKLLYTKSSYTKRHLVNLFTIL
jgi:hypothetical protein